MASQALALATVGRCVTAVFECVAQFLHVDAQLSAKINPRAALINSRQIRRLSATGCINYITWDS